MTLVGLIDWHATTPANQTLEAIPEFSKGGILTGVVPTMNDANGWAVGFVFYTTEVAGGATIIPLDVRTTGTVDRWYVEIADTTVTLVWEISGGGGTATSASVAAAIKGGGPSYITITAVPAGANMSTSITVNNTTDTDTVVGLTSGHIHLVNLNPDATTTNKSVGYVTVYDTSSPPSLHTAFRGYPAERVANRISRLCSENSINYTLVGTISDTQLMGPQKVQTLLDSLRDAEDADQGILYEPRRFLGLAYRTNRDLVNQAARVALSYTGSGEVDQPLDQTEDDDTTGNDWTVTRFLGSSFRAVQETGPMNVQPRPDGIGRYRKEKTLILYADSQALELASWLLHLGTWDEARFPQVNMNLAAMGNYSKTTLMTQAGRVDIGDRLTISNPPVWGGPDMIEQHARGFQEILNAYQFHIQANASPARPYDGYVVETDTSTNRSRIPAGVSFLNSPLTATATTAYVAHERTAWIDTAGYGAMFPFDIAIMGERMTATAITNSAATFIAAGTASHAVNADVTPGLPAGMQKGDLMLIFASIRNQAGLVETPAGYSDILTFANVRLLGKIHSGSESAPTVSFLNGSANADTSAQMCAFRNAQKTLAGFSTQLNGSAANIDVPALTMTRNNCIVLRLGWKQDNWTSVATLAGMTEIGDPSTAVGDNQGLVWDYAIQTTATDLAAVAFVPTGGVSAVSRGMVVALAGDVQTFTVTRSVNGVSKTQSAGDDVQIYHPAVIVL